MHVLVADDDESSRYLLSSMLTASGHTVTTAEDGVDALEAALREPPDLIVSDILMPRMDGYQLCRAWRSEPTLAEVPFVFYTANYAESDDARFAESLGVDKFLVKPMDPGALLATLEELLNVTERGDYTPIVPEVDESEILKEYNARLVNKLERQLEEVRGANEELVRTTDELSRTQRALAGVFSASPVAIVTNSAAGLVTMWNAAAERMFGWTASDVLGKPCPLRTAQGLRCAELIAASPGRLSAQELTVVTRDGTPLEVAVSADRMLDEDPPGSIALFADITEQQATKRDLARTVSKLSEMVDGTITAIAKIVEARDPYTAGHQERVAALAAAIANELGHDGDFTDGVRIAGLIHDIGKIYVPAEILTKPRRLTEVEFSMVQMHPQVAYDVLASIDFPWPVADYVIQHHERLDGTGYPHGLSAEDILTGSRILAVADVVEAMSSHRPYKVAAGIDAALAEISDGRETRYDREAVDACVRLFRERSYRLPDVSTPDSLG